jgi:hypothetical protein
MKVPDRLHVDKADRQLYDDMARESVFKDQERKEQFLTAMAIGYKEGARRPLQDIESSGFFRTAYLLPQDLALINAVAVVQAGSVEILLDAESVFGIAEEFAHGGIQILHGLIMDTQFGSFAKRLEKMLFDVYNTAMEESDEKSTSR